MITFISKICSILIFAITFFTIVATGNQNNDNSTHSIESSIPLDTSDPSITSWKALRKDLNNPRPASGPINVQRYEGDFGWNGIPTFFHMPVALTPQDLIDGDVDVAVVGIGLDMGVGMRGTAFAPLAVRASEKFHSHGTFPLSNSNIRINPFDVLTVVDYGDIQVDPLSTERSVIHIREMIRDVAKTGAIPIVIGGDHSLLYADVAALADVYGKEKIGIVHFDAHHDGDMRSFGHLVGHGKPIYRLIKEGHVLGEDIIQIGIRGHSQDVDSFEWVKEQNISFYTMDDINEEGWHHIKTKVLEQARLNTDYLYISIDMDVLDPAYAPGVSTPEPGGLTTRELAPMIRALCTENNIVGFEIVELNPLVDPGYTTALNANRIARECIIGMAMRKSSVEDSTS